MPIGTSKLGVLGGGLVPGGTATFNASGTFSIPPGVKKVSITGKGGSGNPGNAGNPGSSGNLGTGAAGGAGGMTPTGGGFGIGSSGGLAWRGVDGNFTNAASSQTRNPCYCGGPPYPGNSAGVTGQSGVSGSSGAAGSAGNAGNSGSQSSGLGNTFPGGAGGNAGAAGNGGTGGSGGPGGAGGGGGFQASGGSGGTGGGSGSVGIVGTVPNTVVQQTGFGGIGGGGAGATNDGTSGVNQVYSFPPSPQLYAGFAGRGGTTADYSVALKTPMNNPCNLRFFPGPGSPFPNNTTGGNAVGEPMSRGSGTPDSRNPGPGQAAASIGRPANQLSPGDLRVGLAQPGVAIFSPYPLANPASQAVRSGGGGGGGAYGDLNGPRAGAGGGGGGGRGNVGNAGGAGSAWGSGAAASPTTFNCVPVTPGGSAPITVASPGGQVVISWNPQ